MKCTQTYSITNIFVLKFSQPQLATHVVVLIAPSSERSRCLDKAIFLCAWADVIDRLRRWSPAPAYFDYIRKINKSMLEFQFSAPENAIFFLELFSKLFAGASNGRASCGYPKAQNSLKPLQFYPPSSQLEVLLRVRTLKLYTTLTKHENFFVWDL